MRRYLVLALFASMGCSSPRTITAGGGFQIVEGTVTQFIVRDGRVAAVIWTDFLGQDCSVSGAGGVHDSRDGRRVEWAFAGERADREAVTIDGREYPTAAGRVLLVRTAGGRIEVRQLDREVGDGAAGIAALAKSDADVQAFVAAAQRPLK